MEKEIFQLSTERAAFYYYHYLSILNTKDNNSRGSAGAPGRGARAKKSARPGAWRRKKGRAAVQRSSA